MEVKAKQPINVKELVCLEDMEREDRQITHALVHVQPDHSQRKAVENPRLVHHVRLVPTPLKVLVRPLIALHVRLVHTRHREGKRLPVHLALLVVAVPNNG